MAPSRMATPCARPVSPAWAAVLDFGAELYTDVASRTTLVATGGAPGQVKSALAPADLCAPLWPGLTRLTPRLSTLTGPAGRVGVLPTPGADLGVDTPRAGVLPPARTPHSPWGAWVLIPPLLPAADRRAWRQVFTL